MLIPSSGSSTCLSAFLTLSSVRGCFSTTSVVSVVSVVSATGHSSLRLGEAQRLVERFPRQQGALDAHGVVLDAFQRLDVAQLDRGVDVVGLVGEQAAHGLQPAARVL